MKRLILALVLIMFLPVFSAPSTMRQRHINALKEQRFRHKYEIREMRHTCQLRAMNAFGYGRATRIRYRARGRYRRNNYRLGYYSGSIFD